MPSGPRIRANNHFGTTTDNPLTAGATSFNSAALAGFPVVSSAHAVVVLDPKRVNGAPEIVVITTHTAAATVATITRGAYGTVARSHPSGTAWAHVPVDEDFIENVALTSEITDPYRGQMLFNRTTNAYIGRSTSDAWVNINMLADPPSCRVWNNSAITIPDAGFQLMTYNQERFDTDSMHDTTVNPGRITFNTAGVYVVSFSFVITASSDYTGVMGRIRMDGTTPIAESASQHNVISFNPNMTITTIYKFSAGQYVESFVYADNTSAAANRQVLAVNNNSPEFSACWMGRG